MDKITYLAELAEGLARWVPERERQDILRYYAEYFEEAGPGKEGEVVAELGDPWALSCRLAVEGGFVTQEAANAWRPPQKKKRVWPWVLAGTLAAVVIVGVSVASLASQVGRFVGRFVRNTVIREAVVVQEGTDNAWSEPDWGGPYVEYTDDMIGGFWSMEDGYLDPFYDVDADISMGNITITAGEDYTLAIQQSSNLAGYRVKWELQGDTLKISDDSAGGSHVGLDGLGDLIGQKGVDVIVTVPEGAFLHKLTAKTDFGNVYLSELYVEEKVTAETNLGNVEGYDIRTANKIELNTDCGNVTFSAGELYDSMDIDLNTSLGDVEVSLDCYERDCRYELKTDLGNVTINGVDRGSSVKSKGNALYKLDAESDLGNVDVFFRDDRWE